MARSPIWVAKNGIEYCLNLITICEGRLARCTSPLTASGCPRDPLSLMMNSSLRSGPRYPSRIGKTLSMKALVVSAKYIRTLRDYGHFVLESEHFIDNGQP